MSRPVGRLSTKFTLVNVSVVGLTSLNVMTDVPPGAMALGAPARVRRALTDEERAALRESAAHYVELAARYRAEGWGKP